MPGREEETGMTRDLADHPARDAVGELAVAIGRDISSMLETHRRVTETVDLEDRISRLEEKGK